MTSPSLADAAARARARDDLDHNLVVDAGAGTGKTTVLIDRILSLIAGGRCPLDKIAAITFTEKAAGELKLRLRNEIEERLASESGAVAERFHGALEDLDRAHVSTIHAFCAALLRERPAEAGIDPGFAVLDQLGAFVLRHQVWERWIAGEMAGGNEVVARALDAGIELRSLAESAQYLLENRDLLGLLSRPTGVDVDGFVARLRRDVAQLNSARSDCLHQEDAGYQHIGDLVQACQEIEASEPDAREVFLLTRLSIRNTAGNQRNWSKPERLKAVKETLTELRSRLEELRAGLGHNLCVAITEWLGGYLGAYDRAKAQRGVLDFTDLLLKARDLLLHNRAVRGQLQRRYQALLVDEFQDTDPLQTEIVFFLAERTPRATVWREVEVTPGKLFLVGDPKQSIYRFRRADIELYDEAKRALLQQGDGLDLQTNFRSRRSLVDWVNERFRGLIRRPPSESYQPDYVALAPPPELPRDDGPTVHLLSLPAPVATAELPADQAKRDRTEWLRVEARLVAEYLAELVRAREPLRVDGGARPLGYRDVAILFRDNDAMQWYEDELRDRDIPYRVAGGRRFYGRDEVTALLALIRAVANPKDQVNLVAALRAPFFGFSDEQLYLFKSSGGVFDYLRPVREQVDGSPAFANAFGLLRRLHQRGLEVRPALWLSTVFDELPHLLPLLYLRPQGDQRVANLFKLIDIARAVEAEGVSSLRGLGRFLADLERLQAEEGESPVAEESDDVVRLMTIHKAKGLEFPVVVLADGQRKLSSQTPIGISDRVTGELALRIGKARTGNWERLKEWERPRGEAEEIRLLYVAATRARDHLVLPLYPRADRGDFLGRLVDGEGEQVEVVDPAPYDLQARPVRAFRKAFATLAEAAPDPRAVAAADAWASARAKQIAAGARGPRFRNPSRLAHAGQESGQQELAFGRRDGARVGSLVHAVLQRIDLADPSGLDAVVRGLADAAAVAGAGVEQARDLARRALAMPVLARARAAETCHREVPFTWPVGEGAVEGVIDLVFRERGRLVIVDYKTDDVRPGRALDERVAGYRGQAVIYAAALEAITGESVKEVVLAFLRLGVEKRLRAADWRAGAERLLAPSQNGIEAGAEF